jgi:hypothetical protein
MAQQTAVDWLSERLIRMIPTISPIYKYDIKEYVEQAKAMEKEQMHKCASFWRGKENEIEKHMFDLYYNETYNK